MNPEEIHLTTFNENPPMPVQAQFSTAGWNYMNGLELSQDGQRDARGAITNFLWHHLGPAASGDKAMQKLRKSAFAKFGQQLVVYFPNCFAWSGRIARIGGKQPWAPLLNGISDTIRARKSQNFGRNQPDYRAFWAVTQQNQDLQPANQHQPAQQPAQQPTPQPTPQQQQQPTPQSTPHQQQQPTPQPTPQQQQQPAPQPTPQQQQQPAPQPTPQQQQQPAQQPTPQQQQQPAQQPTPQQQGAQDRTPQQQTLQIEHLQMQLYQMQQELQQQQVQNFQLRQQATGSNEPTPHMGPHILDISNSQGTPKSLFS